jgi:hypothetical protein
VRSRADGWPIVFIVLLMCALPAPARAQQSPAPAGAPDAAAISRALAAVKADPNLGTVRTIQSLQWKRAAERSVVSSPTWLQWVTDFVRWIAQTIRVLVWLAVAVLVGILMVVIVRLSRAYGPGARAETFVAPTHVRSLDIRPETLPPDVGAAARELWDNGDHRAALALLYRGLLSRLVHVHAVPIRASSTEGDCLLLASRHLAPGRQPYVIHLVAVWQRAVYGHHQVDTATAHLLCDGFAAVDSPQPTALAHGGAA